jgi:hypothetical protein
MSRNVGGVVFPQLNPIRTVLRVDDDRLPLAQLAQVNAALDLGLDDAASDLTAKTRRSGLGVYRYDSSLLLQL